jgi:hypothetical protein
MDDFHFDALARSLVTAGSRRRALGGLLAGALGLVRGLDVREGAAHNALKRCKKIDNKAKKQKCVKKAKKHNRTHLSCTPSCDGKSCGDNGCGGVCGACASTHTCDNGRCVCTRSCAPANACGPDGCGDSCGTCTGDRTCQSGQCTCTSVCEPGKSPHPITCNCCKDNGIPCAAPGPDNTCCSGNCVESEPTINYCFVKDDGQECEFNEQCASRKCEPDTCTTEICAIEKYCQPL